MVVLFPMSAFWRDCTDFSGGCRGSPRSQRSQLSVPPPRARLPAESKAFQMCGTRLWLELLTGGPERERERERMPGSVSLMEVRGGLP